ncbi:NADPH:adrenodoxin oxidoreductase, mitochondrial-like isoform X3 [Eriocheir sinensis]|uniref:NADPH:adrenodoxin oxidoreductase, mitochondrial-like isoform X3 n=1 Tax=Eriocheir sinensis TaxID=95602 RepID=UPI0021C9EF80|nr:NADPH:adrenodoxin oxidoreductase, mitochondrial-like isoform X3 [Eriocheir sinensis]
MLTLDSTLGSQPREPGFSSRAEWKNLGGFSDTLRPCPPSSEWVPVKKMLRAVRTVVPRVPALVHGSHMSTVPQVCIVGSGPAGFYTAQQILKSHPAAQVDMYEKLPTPFGLVRYGVAPDHPEVKNCINTFTQTAGQERFAFLGWYNGLPGDAYLPVSLDVESAVVVGHGNVAVDVARILLTPIDILRKTDIPECVLAALAQSRVRRVVLVGRRGPEHVALTIKELREMVRLPGCRPNLQPNDYLHLRQLIPSLPRPRKRLLELLAKTALDEPDPKLASAYASAEREWSLRFLRSPVEVLSSDGQRVSGLRLVKNRLEGEEGQQRAVPTEEMETLECGLVLRSIGYRGLLLDASLPFDYHTATIANTDGRVTGHSGLYVSGWIATGPVGVILSTMTSGFNTGKAVVADLEAGAADKDQGKGGGKAIKRLLSDKGVEVVSFDKWLRLDQHEVEAGARLGKPREKVTSWQRMVELTR